MNDARTHCRAVFGPKSALHKPARAVRLDEHVRIAEERTKLLRVRGVVQVKLGRALATRRLHVKHGKGWQVRRRHEEDVRAVRW